MTSAPFHNPEIRLAQIRVAVNGLNYLLKLLYRDHANLDIITLEDIKRRYPLTGPLGAPATQAIEKSLRIVRSSGDYRQKGLCEFHVGLIYLYTQDCRGAGHRFELARKQWSFIHDTASTCLAYFAEAQAKALVFHYEDAMALYNKVHQCLRRIHLAPPSETHQVMFAEALREAMADAQQSLRTVLWPTTAPLPEEPTPTPEAEPETEQSPPTPPQETPSQTSPPTAVPPPIVQVGDYGRSTPIPDHNLTNAQYHWYEVHRQTGSFLPAITDKAHLLTDTNINEFVPDDLVIVGSNINLHPNIIATPSLHNEDVAFSYFCLGQVTQPFIRDYKTKEITMLLGPNQEIKVTREDVVGLVIGAWLARLQNQ